MLFFITQGFSQYCSPNNNVCYTLSSANNTLNVKIDSQIDGWAGFGVGSNMVGDVVVAWKSGQQVIVSNRNSMGLVLPSYSSNSELKVLSSSVTANGFIVEFTRPISATSGFSQAANKQYMAAYLQGSISSTDPAYSFSKHSFKQNFAFDLATGTTSKSNVDYSGWHGALMMISWMIFVPIAVLVARFGKVKVGAKWFPFHRIFNGLAFLLTTVGLILICVGKNNVVFTTAYFAHPFIGSAIYGLVIIQMFLGGYINKMWNPNRTAVPWHDKLHWAVGYLLLILPIFNVVLALVYSQKGYIYAGIAFYVLMIVIFVVLQLKMGQVHHQN